MSAERILCNGVTEEALLIFFFIPPSPSASFSSTKSSSTRVLSELWDEDRTELDTEREVGRDCREGHASDGSEGRASDWSEEVVSVCSKLVEGDDVAAPGSVEELPPSVPSIP